MENRAKEPIAIIGIGCRFPGNVSSPDELVRFLTEKRSAIREVPKDRWDADALFHPDPLKPAHIHVKRGGFLDQVDQFDCAFFGISPNEARRMDPQQRLVLETAFEAIEDAGVRLEDLAGKPIACVMGCSGADYNAIEGAPTERANINGTTNTGLAGSIVSNRVSYLFDLRGPSFTVDTACSSSLTALHHACRAIWEGAAEGALCGGVNLMLKPATTIGFSKGQYLSPDAECRAFSDHANGYVRAEGAAVVLLKPLGKALADGDRIHALIRGTWLNQDGKTPGMTMPSPQAQEALLRGAYRDAGVDPSQVSVVEAHGTGTPAGDPVEANAIGRVVGAARRPSDPPVHLGSVKTNLGHLESAAGMAGLIKLALELEHRTVFPNLHFRAPSPKIAFDELRLKVPTEVVPLPPTGPLFGGVNAFGFGGANAHAVLESPPPRAEAQAPAAAPALFLSARSATALKLAAKAAFETGQPAALADAYSRRRSRFEFRLAVTGDLAAGLTAFTSGQDSPAVVTGRAGEGSRERVAFVFSGQGGQWWAMGRTLLEHEPVFRRAVEQVDALLDRSVIPELLKDEAHSRMGETKIAQPALFALQVGLAALLRSHGVTPSAVAGHSIGELAAAHVSGALTLEEAARIVKWRSRCQAQAENKGSMAVIGAPEADVKKLLAPYEGAVEIAAINGPSSITVAGTTPQVEALVRAVEASGTFCRRLNVSVPFHCKLMDPIEADFRRALGTVTFGEQTLPYFSTVTGRPEKSLGLDYWWRNIREPVRYLPALEALLKQGFTTLVEVGPSASLRQGSVDAMQRSGARGRFIGTLAPKGDERSHFSRCLAELFCAGAAVDAVASGAGFAPLPHSPFERQTQWLETAEGRAARLGKPLHPHIEALERRVKSRELFAASIALDARVDSYLADHKVQGLMVFPGAGQLEVTQAAAAAALESPAVFLEDVELKLPLVLDDDQATRLKLEVYSDEGHFQIASQRDQQWVEHSRGRVQHLADTFTPQRFELAEVRARVTEPVALDVLFRETAAAGLELGPSFRGIRELWRKGSETLARVEPIEKLDADARRYLQHPALVDSVIQTAALGSISRAKEQGKSSSLALPYRIGRFQIHQPGYRGTMWCYGRAESETATEQTASVWAVDPDGKPVISVERLVIRRVQGSVRDTSATHPANHYRWEWKPAEANAGTPPTRPSGTWVVVGDDALANDIAGALPGSVLKVSAEEHTRGLKRLATGEKVAGLVHASLTSADDLEAAERKGPLAMSQWVQALADRWAAGAEVWLVTRKSAGVAQASLWGFGRVLMSEQPHLSTTLVELGEGGAPLLVEQLKAGPRHHELSLSAAEGARVHALTRLPEAEPRRITVEAATEPFRAIIGSPGVLQSIHLEKQPSRALAPLEVEVQVRAVGLNFKDVVSAMGLLPPEAWKNGHTAAELGIECSGVVTRTGAQVKGHRVGDEVVGCAPICLGNRAISRWFDWVKKPANLSFEQAAALPTMYCTAAIGLEWLAQLQRGETVLVHAGAGGVGIAVIHLAKALGARVFSTTSSEEKRAYLRSLGVEQIFSSRTADFHEQVMAATEGRGVDVVLNSLAGKQLAQGVRCLAPFGRFIEIGKADLYSNRQLGLEFFGENRSFHVLDLNRWVANKPEPVNLLLTRVIQRVSKGELAVPPLKVFPITEAAQAVQALSSGKLIGKVVVSVPKSGPIEVQVGKHLAFEESASCLVTGGTQGFGFEIARRLAERGCKHLVLASRTGTADVSALEKLGARVETVACDVGDREQVRALVARLPRLKGVFHCAMVLDDGPLTQLDAARYAKVSRPKALGAWHLHEATLKLNLEHFVMVSSIASVVGTPGQANYAAANAVLDALAVSRRAQGLKATVLNFGVLDTGVVARASPEQRRKIISQGVGVFPPGDALDALEQQLIADAGAVTVAQINWQRLSALGRQGGRPNRFEGLAGSAGAVSADSGFKERLLALQPAEQAPFIAERIAEHVAAIAGLKERADTETGLNRFGLDSLMSVQLQSWLQNRVGVTVPLMRILRGPSIRELAEEVVSLAARAGKKAAHQWLKQVRPVEGTKARLFCFSYMSAGAEPYQGWPEAVERDVELWTITYPELGSERDALVRGPSAELLAAGADELMELTDLPFGFYGHSMGGWVALDMARELEARGKAAKFVAVGALPTLETMRSILPISTVAAPEEISEDFVVQVLTRMQVPSALLEQADFRETAVALTRRDLWLGVQGGLQRADFRVTRPGMPVWLFGGSADPIPTADKVPVSGLDPAGVISVAGGHLFVEEAEAGKSVAQRVSGWLSNGR